MKLASALIAALFATVSALDWANTGDLAGAEQSMAVILRPGGGLYAGAIIDTSAQDSGAVFFSTDCETWQRCGPMPGIQGGVYGLLAGVGDTLFAASNYWDGALWQPKVYRSGDGGSTWTMLGTIPTPVNADRVWDLLELEDLSLVAAVNWLTFHSSALPARSIDRGQTWTIGTNNSPYRPTSEFCLLAGSDSALYVGTWCGDRRLVYRSTDRGAGWSSTDTMYDCGQTRALVEAEGGILYAGTYPRTVPQENIGRVFRSTDGGTDWQQVGYGYLNSTRGVRCLLNTGDGVLYAGTVPNGEVFSSRDSGDSWFSEGRPAGASVVYDLLEVEVADSTYLYAATGPNGDVFRANLDRPVAVSEPELVRAAEPLSGPTVLRASDLARFDGRILDVSGREVRSSTSHFALRSSHLPPGVYFLKYEVQAPNAELLTRKVIVPR